MSQSRGFGKADRLVKKVSFEQRVREAEKKASQALDDRNLSDEDWQFLLYDMTLLLGILVAEENGMKLVKTKLDGELGVSMLGNGATKGDGVVLLVRNTGSEPPFEVIGAQEGPDWSGNTDKLISYANELLAKPAFAFTAAWSDDWGQHHVVADYGINKGHCLEKAQLLAGEGVLKTPMAVSEQPSLASALVFAHMLNKGSGRLFGGHPYSALGELLEKVPS